jgi:phage terminase large subunit
MVTTKIKLHPAYQPLFREKEKRYFMLTGGRGSGKSFALALFLCSLSTEEKQVILYTRFTLTSAHISIIPEFIDKIEALGLSDQFEISKSEIIHKITGSRIIFRGIRTSSGNQTAALKSIQGVTTWVLDEGEEMPDEATFDKIDESVREKGIQNRIIVALNPAHTSHWIYRRWFERGQQEDTCYIHTTYKHNVKNLSQSFLDRAESVRLANEKKYQHRFLGEWMNAAEGVVFDNWTTGEFDDTLALQCYGQDYGFSDDPTTLVKVAVDKKKKILYLHDCFALPGLSTGKIAELNKKYAEHELIIADSAEPRLIDELQKEHHINIKGAEKGPGSITAGITSMQDYDMVVTPESYNLIKELRNYVYLDKGSKVYIDDYNHSIDAARYAFQFLTKGQVESWTLL